MDERSLAEHPADASLRRDRIPHIWCQGCGIGTATMCFIEALRAHGADPATVCVVSGIGCSGRVAGYLDYESFHTTHGRAIPFALGLKTVNPGLLVTVFSGEGDLTGIGGNHLIHAARRNLDVTVICINNFNYGMTGGQVSPTTPHDARTPTTPEGNPEHPFNLPWLMAAAGAVYVARWTTAHVRQLRQAMVKGLGKRGFSFIEVIAPCPTNHGRRNKLGDGLASMRDYRQQAVVKDFAPLSELALPLKGPIVVGAFVDTERPSYGDELERAREFGGHGNR